MLNDFCIDQGYETFDNYTRFIGDADNDGKADILSFRTSL